MYVCMFVCMYVGTVAIEVRHVQTCFLPASVSAHISVVGTIVNVFESVEMLEKLKRLRKEALDTGKIKFRKETGIDFDHGGVIQLEGTLEQKIKELNRPLEVLNRIELNQEEWNEFEVLERTFRKLLVTKKQEEKIAYIHQDPTKWWKLVEEISRIYMKGGVFTATRLNGHHYKTNFLKYTVRLLKLFPHRVKLVDQGDKDDAYRKYIEESLNEIKTKIQPKFGSKNDGPKPVSKEKLLRLWTTKQKRAIQIIKDGNVACPQIESILENDKIHSHFNRKAGNSYETSDKEKPSWMIDYEPPETLFLEEFEIAEDLLKQIIKCLPNTAPGFDNLAYAALKRHLSLITPSLKTIFTICGRNERVLSDWKIALIILILKTNGNKTVCER